MNKRIVAVIVILVCLITILYGINQHNIQRYNLEEIGDTIQIIENMEKEEK